MSIAYSEVAPLFLLAFIYFTVLLCRSMQYIDREGKEDFYGLSAYPDTLYKKVTLLKYFRSYMSEHLLKVNHSLVVRIKCTGFPQAGASVGDRPVEEGVRLPHLRTWFRTRSAIVLHLSNGILQVLLH